MKIAINSELCLKNIFVNVKCTACTDICPTKSINENLEIDNNCINCGICLSSCPVEAIAGYSYSAEAIRQIISKDGPIRLICQKCQSDSSWPCLGFLDPILLITLISSGKDSSREVAIYLEECRTCNSDVAKYIQKIVEEANQLLSSDKKKIITPQQKFSGAVSKVFSRRQLLSHLWESSMPVIREFVISDSAKQQPVPRRDLFITYGGTKLLLNYIDNQFTFKKITINSTCNTCGVCAKMCVAGALSVVIAKNVLEIKHNPALCKNCGVCAAQCPRHAIMLLPANSLNENIVGRINMPVCTSCGNFYQPIGDTDKCMSCVQEQKKMLF